MKGSLHTDELMREVASGKTGLRTARRISHIFIMDVPGYAETLVHHRRRDQHFPGSRRQARHHSKRHRSLHSSRAWHAAGRNPLRGRNRDGKDSFHHRCRCAVQDGRPRPDNRRIARWTACLRQRHRPGSGTDQRHQVRGCRPGANPGRARSRSRQYVGQEPHIPGQGRLGWDRARRPRADHPHLACGLGTRAHGLVRRRRALRRMRAGRAPRCRRRDR